jgi:hypothetical protein
MTCGWVYVLGTNRPGVVKIGMTTRTPSTRCIEVEANAAYRDLAPFVVLASIAVSDCRRVETVVHRMLADRRQYRRGRREIFRVDLDTAQAVIAAADRAPERPRTAATQHYQPRRRSAWKAGRATRRAMRVAVTVAGVAVALLWMLP